MAECRESSESDKTARVETALRREPQPKDIVIAAEVGCSREFVRQVRVRLGLPVAGTGRKAPRTRWRGSRLATLQSTVAAMRPQFDPETAAYRLRERYVRVVERAMEQQGVAVDDLIVALDLGQSRKALDAFFRCEPTPPSVPMALLCALGLELDLRSIPDGQRPIDIKARAEAARGKARGRAAMKKQRQGYYNAVVRIREKYRRMGYDRVPTEAMVEMSAKFGYPPEHWRSRPAPSVYSNVRYRRPSGAAPAAWEPGSRVEIAARHAGLSVRQLRQSVASARRALADRAPGDPLPQPSDFVRRDRSASTRPVTPRSPDSEPSSRPSEGA